jgi:hypothetical protein
MAQYLIKLKTKAGFGYTLGYQINDTWYCCIDKIPLDTDMIEDYTSIDRIEEALDFIDRRYNSVPF